MNRLVNSFSFCSFSSGAPQKPLSHCHLFIIIHSLARFFKRSSDHEKKSVGRDLGIIAYLTTPGFQKCQSFTLSKHLLTCKLEKLILHGFSIPQPNFSNLPFFVNKSADYELWISVVQAIVAFVSSKIPNVLS
jgi:hypothetical protein